MTQPTIRDATPQDAPRLVPLLAALGYPAEITTVVERLRHLGLRDPDGRVLVADLNSELLGFMTLHRTPTLHHPTDVGRITGIAVAGSERSRGVGRQLVEAAERHFTALGLCRIEVTSGPTHETAYGFYRRLGYLDHGLRFAKPLGQPSAPDR
jgi:ribosomal protein S18 acetylase RimI-like enzyme